MENSRSFTADLLKIAGKGEKESSKMFLCIVARGSRWILFGAIITNYLLIKFKKGKLIKMINVHDRWTVRINSEIKFGGNCFLNAYFDCKFSLKYLIYFQ